MVRANLVATVHSVHREWPERASRASMRRKSRRQLFSDIDEPLYSCGLLESGDDVVGVLVAEATGGARQRSLARRPGSARLQ